MEASPQTQSKMKQTNLWLRMAGAALVLAMTAQSLKAQNAFIDLSRQAGMKQ